MAKTDNLNDFLADIAKGIQLAENESTPYIINPQDFRAHIDTLKKVSGTKTITSAGTHDVSTYANAKVDAGAYTLAGGGLSGGGSVTPTVSLASGSDTNMGNITIGAKDATNYPYYFKVGATSTSGSKTITRAAVTATQTAGYIPASTTAATKINSSSATVTINQGSGSAYVGLKEGKYTVAGGGLTSGAGTVSAAGTGITLGTATTTKPTSGKYITVTGSGKVSMAAVTATQTAGYLPATTTAKTLVSAVSNKSSNTATAYYPISSNVVDTSNATAAQFDIREGYTAWVGGDMVEGVLPTLTPEGTPILFDIHDTTFEETRGIEWDEDLNAHLFSIYNVSFDTPVNKYEGEVVSAGEVITNNVGLKIYHDDIGNASESQVLSGCTFSAGNGFALLGNMTNNGAVTKALAAGGSYTIPEGYHNGSGKVTANSLSSQTSGTAAASHILKDKTAWVNGSKITGTIATYSGSRTVTPNRTQQSLATSGKYLDGNIVVNAIPESYADTSSGDATAAHILSGKKAWVDGSEITGTIATKTSSDLTASGAKVTVPAGYYATVASKTIANGAATVTGGGLTAGAGSVSAVGNGVTLVAATTKPTSGYYVTATGSGKVSKAAISLSKSAGYITGGATSVSSAATLSSNTATAYYTILTQGKEVTPTTDDQTIKPDANYLLSEVVVKGYTQSTGISLNVFIVKITSSVGSATAYYTAGDGRQYTKALSATQQSLYIAENTTLRIVGPSGTYCKLNGETTYSQATDGNITCMYFPTRPALGAPTITLTLDATAAKVDTSSGDATAAEIYPGKKAWVDGVEVTGTMATKAGGTINPSTSATQTWAKGTYLTSTLTVAKEANLLPENIKSGVTICGVTGTYTGSGGGSGTTGWSFTVEHGYSGPGDIIVKYYNTSNVQQTVTHTQDTTQTYSGVKANSDVTIDVSGKASGYIFNGVTATGATQKSATDLIEVWTLNADNATLSLHYAS